MNPYLVLALGFLAAGVIAGIAALVLLVSILREIWRERTAGPRIVRLLTENPLQFDDPTPIEPIAEESVVGFANPEARRLLDERITQWRRWHPEH